MHSILLYETNSKEHKGSWYCLIKQCPEDTNSFQEISNISLQATTHSHTHKVNVTLFKACRYCIIIQINTIIHVINHRGGGNYVYNHRQVMIQYSIKGAICKTWPPVKFLLHTPNTPKKLT